MRIKIEIIKIGMHANVVTRVGTEDNEYKTATMLSSSDHQKFKQGFELEVLESVRRHLGAIQKEILNA